MGTLLVPALIDRTLIIAGDRADAIPTSLCEVEQERPPSPADARVDRGELGDEGRIEQERSIQVIGLLADHLAAQLVEAALGALLECGEGRERGRRTRREHDADIGI